MGTVRVNKSLNRSEIKNMRDLQSSEDSASRPAKRLQPVEMTETADINKGHNGHLTSGRLLARNAVWNLLGNGAPMIVAVVCIPILLRGLGKDRFGVLTRVSDTHRDANAGI